MNFYIHLRTNLQSREVDIYDITKNIKENLSAVISGQFLGSPSADSITQENNSFNSIDKLNEMVINDKVIVIFL